MIWESLHSYLNISLTKKLQSQVMYNFHSQMLINSHNITDTYLLHLYRRNFVIYITNTQQQDAPVTGATEHWKICPPHELVLLLLSNRYFITINVDDLIISVIEYISLSHVMDPRWGWWTLLSFLNYSFINYRSQNNVCFKLFGFKHKLNIYHERVP